MEKVKTAMVGLGKIAWAYEEDSIVSKSDEFPTHFKVLRSHPNFELVAVQDKSTEARSAFAKKIESLNLDFEIYENFEEMLKAETPELLVVASNTESHVEICSLAIDLGVKKILCEKPISYSVEEAETLVKKAEKAGVDLYVNYPRAFNPSYLELCKKIKEGWLGRIQSFDAKYCKGAFNNGTHMVDLLVRMFGDIKNVQGFKNPTTDINKVDPTVSAVISFMTGVNGYLHGLSRDFYSVFELDILGEKGRFKMTFDKDLDGLIDTRKGLYHVYDSIYAGTNSCSGRDALESLRVADSIIRSL